MPYFFGCNFSNMPDKFLIFVFVLNFITTKEVPFVNGSSNSTLQYKQLSYSVYEPGWSLISDGALEVWFRTGEKNAMVLYQDDGGEEAAEFLDVFLVGGKIRMRMKTEECNLQVRIVNGSFNDFNWHKLVIRNERKNTTLSVDDIAAAPLECSPQVGQMTALYTGYLSVRFVGNLAQSWAFPSSQWESTRSMFQGCIKDIQYTENGVVTRPQLRSTSRTERGCNSPCKSLKCRHGGRCVDRILTAWCDCEGTGYHGKHCARVNRETSTKPPSTTPSTTLSEIISRIEQEDKATPSPKEREVSKAQRKSTGVYHGVTIWTVITSAVLGLAMTTHM